MSTFGHILFHGKHLIEVGPVTLRADGKEARAMLKFEQTDYGTKYETERISIHYKQRFDDAKGYWYSLNTLPASEVRAYGKNTLGFDRVRMVLEPKDRDAVAVWLDEVMERSPSESSKFYVEVGWPSYGSRDEITGTNWHRETTGYPSVAVARDAIKHHPDSRHDEAALRVVTASGEEVHHRTTQIYPDDGGLFGLAEMKKRRFEPAFKRRRDGRVFITIGFHDPQQLPEGDQWALDDESTPWVDEYIDGFVGRDGEFYTRAQAARAVRDEYPEAHKRRGLVSEDLPMLRGLGMLSNFINSHRKYYLTGDVWKGKSVLQKDRRLTLERFDASHDSSFFLYFYDGGLIGRVGPTTVARDNKWVTFKKGKYEVRVLRAELLTALEALA